MRCIHFKDLNFIKKYIFLPCSRHTRLDTSVNRYSFRMLFAKQTQQQQKKKQETKLYPNALTEETYLVPYEDANYNFRHSPDFATKRAQMYLYPYTKFMCANLYICTYNRNRNYWQVCSLKSSISLFDFIF